MTNNPMRPSCDSLGCASLTYNGTCTFKADPDIAGIGVVCSFVISMSLTFLLTLYGFYFIPNGFSEASLNDLDRNIIGTARMLLSKLSIDKQTHITQKVFRDTILQFSDTQLVTGLAILLTGFAKTDSITAYHFSIVGDLANMAFVTHLSTYGVIAKEFPNRPQTWWRVVGVTTIALLTTATTVPYINLYFSDLETSGAPMRCMWSTIPDNDTPHTIALTTIYLVLQIWAAVTILAVFFPVLVDNRPVYTTNKWLIECILLPRRAHNMLKRKRSNIHGSLPTTQNQSQAARWIWLAKCTCIALLSYTTYGLTLIVFLTIEIISCEAFALMRNWAFLLVNLIEVFQSRAFSNDPSQGKEGNEGSWGFGQYMPIFLLTLPLATLLEAQFDSYLKSKNPKDIKDADVSIAQMLQNLLQNPDAASRKPQKPENAVVELRVLDTTAPAKSRSTSSTSAAVVAQMSLPYSALDDTKKKRSKSYYFNAAQYEVDLAPLEMEQALYKTKWFPVLLQMIMLALFGGITTAATFGWVF